MTNATRAIMMTPDLMPFMARNQIEILVQNSRGEEGDFFVQKMQELSTLFQSMPKTYEQDGKGAAAVAYLHYFKGGCDWYITEKDMEKEQIQAFGLANLGNGPELGYVSIVELIENKVELDLYWTPKTVGEIKKGN